MFDTTKTIGKALLVAALAGTALTAVSQDAFARGGGFRGGGGGGFHFGGGGFHGGGFHGGGAHFGGGRPSFGGGRHFAAPRSFGGARVSRSFRPRASFARPHAIASHGFAKPFGGMRTSIGGRFAGRPAVGPHFGTGKPNGPLATNNRPGVGPHFAKGEHVGPLALNHGGLKPGHHPGFPGGKGRGPHVRLPGRLLVLGVGLAGVGLADVDDAPVYDNPGYVPVYSGPAPVYTPVAGGPTIPTAPLLPARLANVPANVTPPPVAPTPAAAPEQPAGSFVNVVFQAAVTPKDVETFVKAYNVTIVDGPAPDGTFRIQLSTEPMADRDFSAVVDSMKSQSAFVKDVKPV